MILVAVLESHDEIFSGIPHMRNTRPWTSTRNTSFGVQGIALADFLTLSLPLHPKLRVRFILSWTRLVCKSQGAEHYEDRWNDIEQQRASHIYSNKYNLGNILGFRNISLKPIAAAGGPSLVLLSDADGTMMGKAISVLHPLHTPRLWQSR